MFYARITKRWLKTIYSPQMDAFLAVRLSTEVGLIHGKVICSAEMRMVSLRSWSDPANFPEYIFFGLLVVLIIGELQEFREFYSRCVLDAMHD